MIIHSSMCPHVLTSTPTGVVLKDQGTWNQHSDTTITVSQGRGATTTLFISLFLYLYLFIYLLLNNGSAVLLLWVRTGVVFVNQSGVWNHAPAAQVSLTCKNGSIGIYMVLGLMLALCVAGADTTLRGSAT
jgi:hypothetical protein